MVLHTNDELKQSRYYNTILNTMNFIIIIIALNAHILRYYILYLLIKKKIGI